MRKIKDYDKEMRKVLKMAKEEVGNSKGKIKFADAVFDQLSQNGYNGYIGPVRKVLKRALKENHNHELIKVAYDGGWFNPKANGF